MRCSQWCSCKCSWSIYWKCSWGVPEEGLPSTMGSKDPKVAAQAVKHFEKFFTSEVRNIFTHKCKGTETLSKTYADINVVEPCRCLLISWTTSPLCASSLRSNRATTPTSTQYVVFAHRMLCYTRVGLMFILLLPGAEGEKSTSGTDL